MKGITYTNRNEGKKDKNGRAKKPCWQYRFEGASINGKRQFIQQSGFSTKQKAIVAGTKALSKYNSTGIVFHDNRMSYADLLTSWMENNVTMTEKQIRLLSAKEAGRILGINPNTVYTLWNRGLLAFWQINGTLKTNLLAISEFLEKTKNQDLQANMKEG